MTPVVVLFGAGIGVGIALVISGIWSTGTPVGRPSLMKRLDAANRQAALCAMTLALVVGLITRWPVGAAIGGAVGWTLRSALQPNTSRRVTGRLESLATWIEALRDSIAAHRGLLAAIESTVNTAPPTIRDNVAALVVRIKSGIPLDAALLTFAGELGDAAVDEAIAPLILASRFGGSDLQGLLATAAANTRAQIALWQRTEIARAKPRRDMRLVIAVTLVFTFGVLVIGHGYFRPFGTPVGQIVLLAVAGLFAAGFAAMNRLSRPQPVPRLFDSVSAGRVQLTAHSSKPTATQQSQDSRRPIPVEPQVGGNSMVLIVLTGLGVGIGLAAIVWGLFPPPLTLRAALARLAGEHVTAPTDVLTQGVGGTRRLCGHLVEVNVRKVPRLADIVLPDLAITGTPTETFAVKVVGYAIRPRSTRPGALGGRRRRRACTSASRFPPSACSCSVAQEQSPRSSTCTRPPSDGDATSVIRSPRMPLWCRWPWPGPWGGRAHWRWPPPSPPPTGPWTRSPRACCGHRPTGNNLGKASSGWPSVSMFPTSPTWPGPCPRPVTERASETPWRRRPTRSGSRRPPPWRTRPRP